ncbi:hypothetical protein HJG60_011337 [Phyllostomus discolor]|nr:hypothetical protein HJG60_011337 [Phyllostomus discolor]
MGPHIFQTCPSANYFDCRAMSIGARSQSARTYLERHMSEFMECNLNELVKHGLRALRETLPAEQDLTTKNVSIGIVGKDLEFTIYDDDDVSPFLEGLEERPQRKAQVYITNHNTRGFSSMVNCHSYHNFVNLPFCL